MPISRIDISPLLDSISRDALILAPNHRICDAIISAYANSIDTSVFRTPRVFAVDIWIKEWWELCAHAGIAPFCERNILNSDQELFIWIDVVERSLADTPLLNPEETASTANQSYRTLKLWIGSDSQEQLKRFSANADTSVFARWISSYQKICAQQHCLSLHDAIEELLGKNFDSACNGIALPSEICLVNFLQTPPLYRKLFDKMAGISSVKYVQTTDQTPIANTVRHVFADQTSEILASVNWARELWQSNPSLHIGIICSEDILARKDSNQLLSSALDEDPLRNNGSERTLFNSTGSRRTLLDTALVHDAFLLFGLAHERLQSSDLCRILQSRYLLAADTEMEARLQMELRMRRYFTATASLADFSWWLGQADKPTYAPQLAAALLAIRSRLREHPVSANAAAWARCFSSLLNDLGWPGANLGDVELASYQLWHQALDTLASASSLLGSIAFSTALARLRNICARQALPQHFDPACPLSIYTVTEAVGLHFDHIWFLGFSDRSWPPAASPAPFIPHVLQRQAAIPSSHPDLRYMQASEHFSILLNSVSGTLVASHHRHDDDLELEPSRFIQDFQLSDFESTTAATAISENDTAVPVMSNCDDLAAFALQPQEQVSGGQGIISNQSSCPFRAFSKHRLQVEALAAFESGLSNMARGSAIHAALEQLFSNVNSREQLLKLSLQEREQLVDAAAESATKYLARHYRDLMTPRFRAIEQNRIAKLLLRFLEVEASRSEFRVIAREQAWQWHYDNLQLQLKIDRIDELDDQSLALIDYKTGKHATASQSWLDKRPEDLQLPLYYCVATSNVSQPISAISIAHLNSERIGYTGLVAGSNFHSSIKPLNEQRSNNQDWDQLSSQWQTTVAQLAQEFVAGEARVAPVNGRRTCQHCGLGSLCRIQEIDASTEDIADYESESGAET